MEDLQPGRGPAPLELVGVHLRAAGVVVVEVTPGQHMDLADPVIDDVGDEPFDLLGLRRRHGAAT